MKTPLQTVREAVIAAVPEIMELKFGCGLKIKNYRQDEECVIYSHKAVDSHTEGERFRVVNSGFNFSHKDIEEILGRPIRLADVLKTMSTARVRLGTFLSGNGWFEELREVDVFTHEQGWVATGCFWDLSNDDLSQQSKQTIAFLAELLAPKE